MQLYTIIPKGVVWCAPRQKFTGLSRADSLFHSILTYIDGGEWAFGTENQTTI